MTHEIVMSVTSIGRQFRIAGAEFVKPRHMVKWELLNCHFLRVGYLAGQRSSMETNLNVFKFAEEIFEKC